MFLLFWFATIKAEIPIEFRSLADQAIKNSQKKTIKGLREETKYPGNYKFNNVKFKLLKTVTNTNSNDVKGFAADDYNCAVVKRKSFNISDKYAIIEPDTQSIYVLEDTIASDDKVIIYKSSKTDIFSLMTNFELNSYSTQKVLLSTENDDDDNKYEKSIDVSYNWDNSTNHPYLIEIPSSNGIKCGLGAEGELSATLNFGFKSRFDIFLSVSLYLEMKFGAEIVVPDKYMKKISNINLCSKKIPIPFLGVGFSFLGFEVSLGAYFNYQMDVINMNISIPVGFDLFKGHKIVASKYYEVTTNSFSNPEWNIEFFNLPDYKSINSLEESLNAASLTATLQIKPYFNLELKFGSWEIKSNIGLKIPFVFSIDFDTNKCMFPYLQTKIDIPIKMFHNFSGLKIWLFQIIDSSESESELVSYSFGPFCIEKPDRIIEENKQLIQYDFQTAYINENTDFYEVLKSGIQQVQKQIFTSIVDSSGNKIYQKINPFAKYSTKTELNNQIYVFKEIPSGSEIRWNMMYMDINGGTPSKSSSYAYISFDKLKFINNITTIDATLYRFYPDDDDITKFVSKFYQCQLAERGKVFTRNSQYVIFGLDDFSSEEKYGLIVFDNNGKLIIDYDATFIPDFIPNYKLISKGEFIYDTMNQKYKLTKIYSQSNNVKLILRLSLFYTIDGKDYYDIICNYSIDLSKGYNTIDNIGYSNGEFDFYLTNGVHFQYGGEIIYSNSETKALSGNCKISFNSDEPSDSLPITIYFTYSQSTPNVVVNTSLRPYPKQEIIAKIYEEQFVNVNNYYIYFDEGETYKIFRINNIPSNYWNKNIVFRIPDELNLLIDIENLDNNVYFTKISKQTFYDIPIRRSITTAKNYCLPIIFCKFATKDMIINPKGTLVDFTEKVPEAFIIPTVDSKFLISFSRLVYLSTEHYEHFNINKYNYFFYIKTTLENPKPITFYSTYSYISKNEVSKTIDLTYLNGRFTEFDSVEYQIYCKHGYKVRATMNGRTYTATIINGRAVFTFYSVGICKFDVLCESDSEAMCKIEYPAPAKTGYHLISYPNRDGISTTGRGFLVEAIPVEAGKEFEYHKSYSNPISKYREYGTEPIAITMKINDTTAIQGYTNARKLCLFDENQNIVPFSRKYLGENFDEFINVMGISEDLDLNYFENDADGCIFFHADYIKTNQIKTIPNEVCDLPILQNIKIDNTEIKYGPTETSTIIPTPSLTEASSDFPPISTITEESSDFPPISTITEESSDFPPISTITDASSDFPSLSSLTEASSDFTPISTKTEESSDFHPLSSITKASSDFSPISTKTEESSYFSSHPTLTESSTNNNVPPNDNHNQGNVNSNSNTTIIIVIVIAVMIIVCFVCFLIYRYNIKKNLNNESDDSSIEQKQKEVDYEI